MSSDSTLTELFNVRPPYLHSAQRQGAPAAADLQHVLARSDPRLGDQRVHLAQLRLLQAVPWKPCSTVLFPFASHKHVLAQTVCVTALRARRSVLPASSFPGDVCPQ